MEGTEIAIKTWDLYFPPEEYTIFNKEISKIIEIRKDIHLSEEEMFQIIVSRTYFCSYDKYMKYQTTGFNIKSISCAVSERIFETMNDKISLETRITDVPTANLFSDVNTSNVGSLVNLIGTVCRVGFKKIENLIIFFECIKCNKIIKHRVLNNIYKPPTCSCKNKTLVFLHNHPEMVCVDKQEIKIQEIYTKDGGNAVIDVELFDRFVGGVAPGDEVQIIGFVKAEECSEGYKLKIECNNLMIIKNKHLLEKELSIDSKQQKTNLCKIADVDFAINNTTHFIQQQCSEVDFQQFKCISEEKDLMSIFVTNLFPDIFGNSDIKAGLVLALFGGTKKYVGQCQVRSEIHVLIVGDPGLGKSKMLLSLSGLLPKSTYVSGSFCTTAGLTVSITHDPATGEYMADAGALVVSDGGICCIDEFDKIDDHNSLFEVMEGQQITVAKGGVVISVPTRTTIIAASNPKHGHFDTEKSIRENLKFDGALLSRFDLVFIMLDNLTEQENHDISSQILKRRIYGENSKKDDELSDLLKNYHTSSFIKRSEKVYSKEILKKYIDYARSTVAPVLSASARSKLHEYFMSIRTSKHVSIRTLESLIRLTESCAKMELKAIANVSHAIFAINLYKKVFIKEEVKSNNKGKKLDEVLKNYVENNGTDLIQTDILENLIQETIPNKNAKEVIEIYNYKGVLLKKNSNEYKIVRQ